MNYASLVSMDIFEVLESSFNGKPTFNAHAEESYKELSKFREEREKEY